MGNKTGQRPEEVSGKTLLELCQTIEELLCI